MAATTELAALEARLLSAWKRDSVLDSHHQFSAGRSVPSAYYTAMVIPRVVSNRICGLSSGRLWIICLCIAQYSAVFHMRQSKNVSSMGKCEKLLTDWLPDSL